MTGNLKVLNQATTHVAKQLREYRQARRNNPHLFGCEPTGAWDGTPAQDGPAYVIGTVGDQWRVLWGFHKHPWADRYNWIIGQAKDARGERTDLALVIDLRALPYPELLEKLAGADNYFEVIIDLIESTMRDGLDLADFTIDKTGGVA